MTFELNKIRKDYEHNALSWFVSRVHPGSHWEFEFRMYSAYKVIDLRHSNVTYGRQVFNSL